MSNRRNVIDLIEQHVSSLVVLSPFQGLVPLGVPLAWVGQGKVAGHPVLVAVSQTRAAEG